MWLDIRNIGKIQGIVKCNLSGDPAWPHGHFLKTTCDMEPSDRR